MKPKIKLTCENCADTGYVGDNGPGIKGNRNYVVCECRTKKEPKIKPVTAWAVVSNLYGIVPDLIRFTSGDAISSLEKRLKKDWDFLKIKGFDCIKVRITPMEER